MGAQASAIEARGDAATAVETVRSEETKEQQEDAVEQVQHVEAAVSVASVRVEKATTVVTVESSARPPAASPAPIAMAPARAGNVPDRVVELRGVITHAYPVVVLRGRKNPSGGDDSDGDDAFGGDFSVGSGPCGPDATQVAAWEVQLHDSYQTCYVYLYDKWADAVQHFTRHYKVHLRGLGLVALDHWDIGHDTEDMRRCFVVADGLLLRKTASRSPRLLPKPQGVSVEIAFEEPQRVHDSEQIRYLPEQVIRLNEVYAASPETSRPRGLPRPQDKPNPRGKRSLRVIEYKAAPKIATPSSYMYTPLAELIPGNANIYGVVVNMSLPKRSEGKDFYMTLQLVDESCPKREDAVQVIVFLPTLEQMPRILHVGDIVRFHKIHMKHFKDSIQGVGHSRATRYLVLRKGPTGVEQQTYSASWTFDKYDEERVNQLTAWAAATLPLDTTLPHGCPQAPRWLGDMQHAESFTDVVVRVLHVQKPYEEFTLARLIIWDGSGDASTCRDLYEKLHRENAPFIPDRGLLMEVIMNSCWVVVETIGFVEKLTTQWCRFRNLAVSAEQGEAQPDVQRPVPHWYELHFREVSSLMFVPDTLPEVRARLGEPVAQISAERSAPVSPPVRGTTRVPDCILSKVPVAAVRTVVTSKQVPRKYHCLARAVKMWPSAIEQITKPKDAGFIYSFVMRLEDATGHIDVIVHGEDAEKFLHGIPPCDLTKNSISRGLLRKRLASLMENSGLAHFCVKSYRTKSTSTSEGNSLDVRFRLFDTILQIIA